MAKPENTQISNASSNPMLVRKATRSGIPPLKDYLREAYRFRVFALYWSKGELKSRNFDTLLGRLWHYLNPFLFGLIYFVFVGILTGGGLDSTNRLAFMVFNLYVWTLLISQIIVTSVNTVRNGGGGVLANSSIPRVVIPAASSLSALNLFVRSLIAYIPLHLLANRGIQVEFLWIPILLVLTFLFAFGVALLAATVNIYLRDVSRFLPHFLRLWMYLSPAIWEYQRALESGTVYFLARLNPTYSLFSAWTMVLGSPEVANGPSIARQVAIFSLWAIPTVILGFLVFISREDEFAIRN
tara:strand:- start:18419 stop:19312 length:894 start_codon:yes stop_codon:yes gene_type:complete